MTKEEELYGEFLEVTHFDERFIDSYGILKNIYVEDVLCASEFEGLMIRVKNPDKLGVLNSHIITYFHNEQRPKTNVLDKIRAEIKSLSNANPSYWNTCDVVEREDVLDIIDKYRQEG